MSSRLVAQRTTPPERSVVDFGPLVTRAEILDAPLVSCGDTNRRIDLRRVSAGLRCVAGDDGADSGDLQGRSWAVCEGTCKQVETATLSRRRVCDRPTRLVIPRAVALQRAVSVDGDVDAVDRE